MQHCQSCDIDIRGNKSVCPLCHGALSGEPEAFAFPALRKKKLSKALFLKISAFVFIAAFILVFALHYLTDFSYSFMTFLLIGLVIGFLDLYLVTALRFNVIKILTSQVLIGLAICLWIDILTRFHGWSLSWLIPVSLVGLAVAIVSIGKGLHLLLADYILYLALIAALSLLQLIPVLLGITPFPWPAILSMAFFAICAAAALLFYRRDFTSASSKVFNM